MKNFKIRVKSPEHSKKIQEHLLTIGWTWYKECKYLLFDSVKYIMTYSDDEYFFNNHPYPEVELVETVSYEFKEIPKREVVNIGEKSYFLDELEIALKNINPI